MDRSVLYYIVDIFLGISFFFSGITGLIKFKLFFPFTRLVYELIPSRTISSIHQFAGIAMIILVLIHLISHWNFISGMTRRLFRGKNESV